MDVTHAYHDEVTSGHPRLDRPSLPSQPHFLRSFVLPFIPLIKVLLSYHFELSRESIYLFYDKAVSYS